MNALTTEKFSTSVEDGVWVIDFYAEWCQPCKVVVPMLKSLESSFPNVNFATVNVDDNNELANTYKISGVPTILFFKDGVPIDRQVGISSEESLKSKIEKL